MNYRLRDAIIGLSRRTRFDAKGFADSGRQLAPSEFASRLESIREDYADAAYFSAMNLLDSHDTERLRWTLTPGAETRDGQGAGRGERRRRQAPPAARVARPVHARRRADRLLRRRGRRHRRRRPGRPAHDTVAGDGRERATSRCSSALPGARPRCARGTDALRDGSLDVLLADDAAGDGRLRPQDGVAGRDRRPQPQRRRPQRRAPARRLRAGRDAVRRRVRGRLGLVRGWRRSSSARCRARCS